MSRFSLRLLAGCLLLTGLAFTQDPGYLVADTKFDLAVAPADFLARALHLWDGEGALGQLQNQAYGYLFPTGPFFLAGVLAGIPGWVVQRLWWALVLSVAFAGAARVTRALGVRSDLACLLAGAAYATSPRLLSTLGPISSESWPVALAPWVLLPLVVGAERGSPRRAAALAGLGVAAVGGINAAATFAVIPLGAVWLLTRTPGPRRRALMLWWPVCTLLGTLWWLVPLVLMGGYSPPFLQWIETASVTTFPTALFDALRGTSNWVAYVDPTSRAGRDLLTTPYLALDAGVVLLLGLAGLLLRTNPHRAFLARSLLVGLLLVTLGHTGAVQGWGAAGVQDLLDGVLSPIRNVHKFDPVVRLPLVVGLAFLVDALVRSTAAARDSGAGPGRQERFNRLVLLGTAVLVVAAGAVPALAGRVAPAQPVIEVPAYWAATARWLAEQDREGDATALLAPGSPFARYVWGSPDDEPLQWLADSRWAVRNVVPLVPAGNIRALDGIERRLARGEGSPGLADALARAGIRYVVVRNDLARGDDVPDPVLVRQALRDSPGLAVAEVFGPVLGGEARLEQEGGREEGRAVVGGGWQTRYRAVEVWEVAGAERAVLAEEVPVVVGGPEDLPDLADLGVLDRRPTVLAVDAPEQLPDPLADGPLVLTDGLRAREHAFARIHDADSPVWLPGMQRRNGNPTRDYLLAGSEQEHDRWLTTGVLRGARAVSASSSASDTDTLGPVRREAQPYAALDGDPQTAWRSAPFAAGDTWWQLDLAATRPLAEVTLTGGPTAAVDQRVVVVTDTGRTDEVPLGPGQRRRVVLEGEPTSTLRVTAGAPDLSLSLAEVELPGLSVRRLLALPEVPTEWGTPDAVVLRADRDARSGCVGVGDLRRDRLEVRCTPSQAVGDEEPDGLHRLVTLGRDATYDEVALRGRPRAGAALDELVLEGRALRADASSTALDDPRAGALAAVDGDPGTAWLAEADDPAPTLVVAWLDERDVTGLRVRLDPDVAGARPERVRLTWAGGSRVVTLDEGRARFPAIATDRLSIEVLEAEPVVDLGFEGAGRDVGVGIGELRLRGVPYEPLKPSLDPVRYPCGTGPELRVGSTTWPTRVVASPGQLLGGGEVDLLRCGREARRTPGVALAAGETEVHLTDSAAVEALSVVLGSVEAGSARAVPVTGGDADRTLDVPDGLPTGGGIVAGRENTNPGWTASRGGEELTGITVDGWQQGWLLPGGGEGPVRVSFGPDGLYRAGLLVGLLALLGLLAVVAVPLVRRRGPARDAATAPLAGRRHGRVVAGATAVAAGGLLAGWAGAAAALVLAPLAWLLADRAPAAAPWVLAAPVLGAGAWYAARPWGDPSGWAGSEAGPAYLALVPVLAVLLLAADRPRRRASGWNPFRRSAGRSTSR